MSGGRAQNFYDPGNCGVASVLKDALILVRYSNFFVCTSQQFIVFSSEYEITN